MINLRVIHEYAVDAELILEQSGEEWDIMGPSFGNDPTEFIMWLVDSNTISHEDLGELMERRIEPL